MEQIDQLTQQDEYKTQDLEKLEQIIEDNIDIVEAIAMEDGLEMVLDDDLLEAYIANSDPVELVEKIHAYHE